MRTFMSSWVCHWFLWRNLKEIKKFTKCRFRSLSWTSWTNLSESVIVHASLVPIVFLIRVLYGIGFRNRYLQYSVGNFKVTVSVYDTFSVPKLPIFIEGFIVHQKFAQDQLSLLKSAISSLVQFPSLLPCEKLGKRLAFDDTLVPNLWTAVWFRGLSVRISAEKSRSLWSFKKQWKTQHNICSSSRFSGSKYIFKSPMCSRKRNIVDFSFHFHTRPLQLLRFYTHFVQLFHVAVLL